MLKQYKFILKIKRKLNNDSYKNVELTNRSSERWANYSVFIGHSTYGGLIYKGNLTISVFSIYVWYMILNYSGQTQPCQTKSSWFLAHRKINLFLFLILEILDFQESFTIWSVENILDNNVRPRILPDMEFGMGS